MATYTEEQVEEMVQEAVNKSERSFGGTVHRLKVENEKLKGSNNELARTLRIVKREMCLISGSGCINPCRSGDECKLYRRIEQALKNAEEK